MRRVNHGELIGLLRGALRACELEAETAQLTRESSLLVASAQAHRLLEERRQERGFGVEPEVCDELLTALPLTSEGRLHAAAFLALVEARVWSHREQQLAALTGARGDTDHI